MQKTDKVFGVTKLQKPSQKTPRKGSGGTGNVLCQHGQGDCDHAMSHKQQAKSPQIKKGRIPSSETVFNGQNLTLTASYSYLIDLFSDIPGGGLHE